MTDRFQESLKRYFKNFFSVLATEDGDWTVKGFIDLYKNIYAISDNAELISKIIELMILPIIMQFAKDNEYEILLGPHPTYYPDITAIDKESKESIALTLKSTCRISDRKVNGMSLGTYTGYFRSRASTKNIQFPYSRYSHHFVLGIVYTKTGYYNATRSLEEEGITLTELARKALSQYISRPTENSFYILSKALRLTKDHDTRIRSLIDACLIDELRIYTLDQLHHILSVVRDINFFIQEKWKIAGDRPAHTNPLHIGSATSIKELMTGTAIFTKYRDGESIFNDYWTYYLATSMARAVELEKPPYTNISEYFRYKGLPK